MSTHKPQVELHTSKGVILLELDDALAPESVRNFLAYVKAGHYDGTVFHRVIKGFMVQCGGFAPGMKQKPTQGQIQNESANGLENKRYTLAMARTSAPHSATAQFFINTKDNGFLNKAQSQDGWGYAVFGKVVGGMDVVDAIEAVRTGNKGGHSDVPVDDLLIERATLLSKTA
jgi:peptidyl-prolyl cis-trans isomerase B (cyclophilin B)